MRKFAFAFKQAENDIGGVKPTETQLNDDNTGRSWDAAEVYSARRDRPMPKGLSVGEEEVQTLRRHPKVRMMNGAMARVVARLSRGNDLTRPVDDMTRSPVARPNSYDVQGATESRNPGVGENETHWPGVNPT